MAGSSVLLIDYENFYLGREKAFRAQHPKGNYESSADLDLLLQFATQMAAPRRFTVQRAYADFNAYRYDDRAPDGERGRGRDNRSGRDRPPNREGSKRRYYLQTQPNLLMENGVEPIQVFRFPGGGNKNAADMRLALDAAELCQRGGVEQFILVSGDSDFIPVVLDLKRVGAEVAVIGVRGSTKEVLQRYCDTFEFFEDLLAAQEVERESPIQNESDLAPIRDALHKLLAANERIKFAAVKPLLAKVLGQQFNPMLYGYGNTGDFLRECAKDLGIVAESGEHDWEIRAAGPPPPPVAQAAQSQTHSSDKYRELLRNGARRYFVHSPGDWQTATEAIFQTASGRDLMKSDLEQEVAQLCEERGLEDAVKKARATIYLTLCASCFVCAQPPFEGQHEFEWSDYRFRLDPQVASLADLQLRTAAFLGQELKERLAKRKETLQIAPLAELFYPTPTPELVQALEQAVARGEQE